MFELRRILLCKASPQTKLSLQLGFDVVYRLAEVQQRLGHMLAHIRVLAGFGVLELRRLTGSI